MPKNTNLGHRSNGSPTRPSVLARKEKRAAARAATAAAMAKVAGK